MNSKDFTQRWVRNMMDSIDAYLDEETKIGLMESCGRACARSGVIGEAWECRGDLDKMVSKLKKWVGKENVRKDGNVIEVVYSKCFCELVADGPPTLPDIYCTCSRGWLKEMFEAVVGKPVDVDLMESIKRGGRQCRFIIHLP